VEPGYWCFTDPHIAVGSGLKRHEREKPQCCAVDEEEAGERGRKKATAARGERKTKPSSDTMLE
jgi:hypothetical protein